MSLEIICIIQARSTSKRLPKKMLLDIAGKPVIERVINRVKAVNEIKKGLLEKIVVAIPMGDPLILWCKDNNVSCFEGSENDVLGRFYACAKKYEAKWILRITGDCPLIDPFMLYGLITKFPRYDYQALAFNGKRIPAGWDAELFSFKKLQEVNKNSQKREHVTQDMRGMFEDYLDLGTDFNFKDVKYDLDTPEDLERIRRVYELIT